jgi:hypothetical protein
VVSGDVGVWFPEFRSGWCDLAEAHCFAAKKEGYFLQKQVIGAKFVVFHIQFKRGGEYL